MEKKDIIKTDLNVFDVADEPEVTAVSRSGRIIKRSSKLLGFESSELRT